VIQRSKSLEEALNTLKTEQKRIELALLQAARRRQTSLEEVHRELERIGDLAMDAMDAGSTASDICKAGGISRRTLYKMLDERGYTRHRDK
jgi:CRP-like cAMP-binding protein